MNNEPKFSAEFKDHLIEAVQTGMNAKPIVAAGLSVQVTGSGDKLTLRAFLVGKDGVELVEIASARCRVGDVFTLLNLDQTFKVGLG